VITRPGEGKRKAITADADREGLTRPHPRGVALPHPHPRCFACDPNNRQGLRLKFHHRGDGSVESVVQCSEGLEGYPQELHGGIIGLWLDAAMTNCLFKHGCAAVTGELKVRYRHPMSTSDAVLVRAWVRRSRPPLHFMEARILQKGHTMAGASAKFMER